MAHNAFSHLSPLDQLERLAHSPQPPRSPEARRVRAAARVGLSLIRGHVHLGKPAEAAAKHGPHNPLQEHKLPGCIRQMLEEYRSGDQN